MTVFYLIFGVACFAHLWVHEFTSPGGFLSFLPGYIKFDKPFFCDLCIGGWIMILTTLILLPFSFASILKAILYACIEMVIAKALRKFN